MNKTSKKQNDLCQEALDFTRFLAEQYFVERGLNTLTQYMDEQVSWIGTGDGEISRGINEAKGALEKELLEYGGSFIIKQQWFEAVPYNEELCIVYGAVKAEPADSAFAKDNLRLSLMIKRTETGMKLIHLHLSHPDMDQEKGCYYVPEAARSNTINMRRQLDILNHNIPGGAHQCKNNPNLTIISMSDSFLTMFGYTSEEIGTLFHNNFIEMVYPGDRAALLFSQNWYKKFGYSAIDNQISGRIPLSKNIHPEDMPAFIKIMKDTAAGVPYSETEFRIKNIKEKYYWCRIRATTQFDSDGRAVKAVGVIVDIDGEKKQKQTLLDMAQKDALTGLYNKATVNALVEQRMKELRFRVKQAFLILDVDHFKNVNDTYGHLVGDSILSEVAAVIKKQIRSTDIAGRIGGDEFLVYLTEVTGEAAVAAKAAKLLAAFEIITPESGVIPITCSIGIVVFSDTDTDYQTLYQCADQALYEQKSAGRGRVTFYHEGMGSQSSDDIFKSALGMIVGSESQPVQVPDTVPGQISKFGEGRKK